VEGLPDAAVNAIAVGADNTVWLGTNGGGLRRLELAEDGTVMRASTHTTAEALTFYGISDLAVTPDGALWAPGDAGIVRFDGTEWITYTTPSVTDMAVGADGSLWALTLHKVQRFEGTEWRTYTTADGLPDTTLARIATAPNGDVWVSTYYQGLAHFDGATWEIIPFERLPDGAGVALAVTSDGALWLALRASVARYANGRWEFYPCADDIQVLTAGADGALWVGVVGGVYRFAGGQRTSYGVTEDPAEGLSDRWVHAITMDRDGVVWVGTMDSVARFDGKTWARYARSDGLIHIGVSSIAASPDGTLWFGYSKGGVSHFVPQP
jgi:ligand-binding sensor domain-containing protein